MRLTVLAVVASMVLALALGGRPRHVAAERLRWPALLVGALALYWLPSLLDPAPPADVVLVALGYATLLAFVAVNLRLVGMPVVLVGLCLNTAVIAANQNMPVDARAVVVAGLARPEELGSLGLGPARRLLDPTDRLAVLGDVVPVPGLREVVSFGDLILAAGLANVTFRLLYPAGQRSARPAGAGRSPERGHQLGPVTSAAR
ncbi:MAG: DUF5317 family protein [Acidimicrobiales bacterium]